MFLEFLVKTQVHENEILVQKGFQLTVQWRLSIAFFSDLILVYIYLLQPSIA